MYSVCPVQCAESSSRSNRLVLFLSPYSDILVKAQEGKRRRGEHIKRVINYMSEWDFAEPNCLFRNSQECF